MRGTIHFCNKKGSIFIGLYLPISANNYFFDRFCSNLQEMLLKRVGTDCILPIFEKVIITKVFFSGTKVPVWRRYYRTAGIFVPVWPMHYLVYISTYLYLDVNTYISQYQLGENFNKCYTRDK